jgi:murein DD-endopeptidase MepM/ murein hydrolase activator NlpD
LGAYAFSLADFLGTPAEAASAPVFLMPNSKTPALQPAKNIDPNPAKGGGDITIVGGVALLPETGPEGTMADIANHTADPDQISIYVVREGDSLSSIGKLFGVSANTILWANDLKSSKDIHKGDTLVILPVNGVQHVVQKGETLASIVKKYKGDMSEVLAFNRLPEGAKVAVGDSITIPEGIEPAAVVTSSGTTSKVVKSAGGPLISGYFMRPLLGGIKTQGLHGYNGIDIGVPVGTQVLASAAGTVIIARDSGWNGGYGDYVVIQHPNGTQTLYAHLSQVYVSAGSNVVQGQVLGLSGRTGKSTGAHLHFEIRGAANPF